MVMSVSTASIQTSCASNAINVDSVKNKNIYWATLDMKITRTKKKLKCIKNVVIKIFIESESLDCIIQVWAHDIIA